jgi:hypothetical protein
VEEEREREWMRRKLCCRWGIKMPEENKGKRDSREERQLGFSKGVYAKLENCRGLFVKQNFPLI